MKQIPGEAEHKEEMIDMCKAIQEMYDDGVKDGIQQGVEQGRTELLKVKYTLESGHDKKKGSLKMDTRRRDKILVSGQ